MQDSAIRVSLTARLDDAIVGFLMARADLGDSAEPVAVLDTLGVDLDYAPRCRPCAAVATVRQPGALQVERVETVLAPGDLPLQGSSSTPASSLRSGCPS